MYTTRLQKVFPGISSKLVSHHFKRNEWFIINKLAKEFYVTSGGGELKLGISSNYRYFLIKPTDHYNEMFNLEREIIVLFSPYNTFEPRTLDAIDKATAKYQQLRLERIVSILISEDKEVESKIRHILAAERETQIIVPFTYQELLDNYDEYFISNRFRDHFFNRDLFAYEKPLTKDLYFFGRTHLIQDIVNRYRSNENSGLFGLRKTGKTSVIYAITRVLDKEHLPSIVIDCQDPAFHQRRWNEALNYVIDKTAKKYIPDRELIPIDEYNEKNAPLHFESEIKSIVNKLKGKVLLIFDEIENITHGIAASEHWRNSYDFIYFWQTIRALSQKEQNIFNFLIVGTNPKCVEEARFKDIDNPILNLVPFQYIPRFEFEQTKEMVCQLGGIMGLKFDNSVLNRLTEDYGGHPYLIRHCCSVIHQSTNKKRPVIVGRSIYEKAKSIFNKNHSRYIDMILEILHRFYPDEYEMLKLLALGDVATFNEFANISPTYISHLLGYGILDTENDEYSLKVEVIREHLAHLEKYRSINLSSEDMLAEISERRNKLEPQLRFLIRTNLASRYGEKKAYDLVMNILDKKREKLNKLSYEQLFDPNKSTIFLNHLKHLISKNWECFQNIFSMNRNDFEYKMDIINKYRRVDAHSAKINNNELYIFRACISDIEDRIKNYIR